MRITPQPIDFDLLASDLVRHPGLHASNIYNNLYEELEPKRFRKDSKPNPLRMALGTAWEVQLEYLLTKAGIAAARPPAFISPDGIAYSPDLIITEPNSRIRVGEIKLTYMSSRDMPRSKGGMFPPKFDKYLTQMMIYAHWLETTLGRLYVLFVLGDYKMKHFGYEPELLSWDIEFSKRELKENYDTLMSHAKMRKML